MLIAIVTFQYDNYGSRLQNYALCESIRGLGAEPVSLSASSMEDRIKKTIRNTLARFPAVSSRQYAWRTELIKEKSFREFHKRLSIREINYKDLSHSMSFDLAIAGSDQIWSPEHMARRPMDAELFFLMFVPKEKRIAYAPSFGVDVIPCEMIEEYKGYIHEFDTLSVRERTGQVIVCALLGREVPILPDPTFLLSREQWTELAKEPRISRSVKKYLLVYFLSKQGPRLWERIRLYAGEHGLEIICITGNICHEGDIVPAPDEFVSLVNAAEVVFTDSFHGSVFSILFQTHFVVCKRTDVEQFTRIENLLSKFKLESALYKEGKPFEENFLGEDFLLAESIVAIEREKGLRFLREAMVDHTIASKYGNPKVSIAVAIYNIEKYVGKCIQSIIEQSYPNIEIILVDDGSSDTSGEICDEYARKDKRIRVIHQENGRLPAARNAGLDVATGDFIVFVDGDDWLAPDFTAYMLGVIFQTSADMAISTKNFTTRDTRQVDTDRIETWTPEKATADFLYPKISIGCWNKIYRRDFIEKNKLRFKPELITAEGFTFINECAQRVNHVGVGHRKVYWYRLNNAESATTKPDIRQGTGALYALEGIKSSLFIRTPMVMTALTNHFWLNHFYTIRLIYATHSQKENQELLRENIVKLRRTGRDLMKARIPMKSKIKKAIVSTFPVLVAKYQNHRIHSNLEKDTME